MIERFNFYDIYGYLIPGTMLVGLLWLPFGIINRTWPAEIATTVLVLGFSYVVGHVLQTIATTTIQSKVKDKNGKLRAPSDLMLDPNDNNLAAKVKSSLAACVSAEFGIDLGIDQISTGSDEICFKRTDAFFLCRGLLIREKIATYAEQFEGLYAMFRGLSVAFFIGAIYLAGWGCSTCAMYCFRWGAIAISTIGFVGVFVSSLFAASRGPFHANKTSTDRWLVGFVLVAVFGLGMHLGATKPATVDYLPLLWISALTAFVASTRCYSGYRAFAMHFAKAVWRDFLSFKSQSPNNSKENDLHE